MTVQAPPITEQFLPEHAGRGRDGYTPQIIVVHTQAGTGNPFNWFKSLGSSGAKAADSTCWISKAGKIYRYLNDTDEAWTNGWWTEPINHKNPILEGLYNQGIYSGSVSLTVENEGYQTFTDAQYKSLAQLVAYWCDKWKIPCDRNHIVGHSEIGPHKQCPGPNFDFDRLIKDANALLQTAQPAPPDQPLQLNGFNIQLGFKVRFLEHGKLENPDDPVTGGIKVFGLPLANEKVYPDGVTRQPFERYIMEFNPNAPVDWRDTGALAGADWLKAHP